MINHKSFAFLKVCIISDKLMTTDSTHKIILGTAIIALLAAAFTAIPSKEDNHLSADPPETVSYVDVERYLGRWYEQASIPANFETSC